MAWGACCQAADDVMPISGLLRSAPKLRGPGLCSPALLGRLFKPLMLAGGPQEPAGEGCGGGGGALLCVPGKHYVTAQPRGALPWSPFLGWHPHSGNAK